MYRIDQEADRLKARSLSAELESARRDTDQLRSLTLRGDATVQDLLARLKVRCILASGSRDRLQIKQTTFL